MNLQVIASPGGAIVWVSGPLPGAVHDLTADRIWGIVRELAASGLVMLDDKGYLGEDCIRTPYRGRNKPAAQKDANRAHARLRTPGERANARLKTLAHPAQAPLLPLARRSTGQGHPCPSDPRNRWMKKAQRLHRVFTYSSLRLPLLLLSSHCVLAWARVRWGIRRAMRNPTAIGRDLAVLGGCAAAPEGRARDSFAEPPRTLMRSYQRSQQPMRSIMRGGFADRAFVHRRELRYGSREFLAASDLARRLPYSPRISAFIGSLVREPALLRVVVAVRRLPVIDLRVRRADVDAWREAHFGPARHGRLAQAVLNLPTVEKHYLAGRHKQALRTNLRHARDLGVTSDRVPTYEEWCEAASIVLDGRPDGKAAGQEMDKPEPGQHVAYYVARDAQDTPLAYAGVALFGQFAVLFAMLSHLDRHPSASWARYQLHTFLALDLGRSGVSYLLVGSALRETTGNQYFQHLLGYRARNLRFEVIESGATWESGAFEDQGSYRTR
jgi:hypothetical protein